jgi:hypothetical protein
MTKEKSLFFSLTVLLIVLPTAVVFAQSTTVNQLQAASDEWRVSSEIAGAVLAIDVPGQGTIFRAWNWLQILKYEFHAAWSDCRSGYRNQS